MANEPMEAEKEKMVKEVEAMYAQLSKLTESGAGPQDIGMIEAQLEKLQKMLAELGIDAPPPQIGGRN